MRFSVALLGSQLLIASTILANPIATDKALAPALAARNEFGTLVAPNDGKLVGRDASAEEDGHQIVCIKLKRDAEIAAEAASESLSKYLAARSLVRRDTDSGEDDVNGVCSKLKRDAAAAAAEAATAYERYAQSLEN